jgi:hypothetical protein
MNSECVQEEWFCYAPVVAFYWKDAIRHKVVTGHQLHLRGAFGGTNYKSYATVNVQLVIIKTTNILIIYSDKFKKVFMLLGKIIF